MIKYLVELNRAGQIGTVRIGTGGQAAGGLEQAAAAAAAARYRLQTKTFRICRRGDGRRDRRYSRARFADAPVQTEPKSGTGSPADSAFATHRRHGGGGGGAGATLLMMLSRRITRYN